MRSKWIHALMTAALALLPMDALGQLYPTKPLRLIVPFSPGGTNDIYSRVTSQPLKCRNR